MWKLGVIAAHACLDRIAHIVAHARSCGPGPAIFGDLQVPTWLPGSLSRLDGLLAADPLGLRDSEAGVPGLPPLRQGYMVPSLATLVVNKQRDAIWSDTLWRQLQHSCQDRFGGGGFAVVQ